MTSPHSKKYDHSHRMASDFKRIIMAAGEDVKRDGLIDTPKRAAEAFKALTSGYTMSIEEVLNDALFDCENKDLVVPNEVEYSNFSYLFMGFEHLLGGYDHILFVFGLVFLISGWFNLIKTITSFTIAHSITLALSSLGVVKLPQTATEAVIADESIGSSRCALATQSAISLNTSPR